MKYTVKESMIDIDKLKKVLEKTDEPLMIEKDGNTEMVIIRPETYNDLAGIKEDETQEEKDRREMVDTLAALRNQYW